MSKLSPENKFIDFSDYGRVLAKPFAKSIVNTPFTPVHVTLLFFIAGLIAIYYIIQEEYLLAAIFLVIKSIIDAADGELARLRNKPSYIGRYLDSILDLVLNFLILFTIYYLTNGSFWLMLLSFFAIQLQGTVYNYYYIILRNNSVGGDTTSRVEEKSYPKALHGESQKLVNILFIIFTILYGAFDNIVLTLDKGAKNSNQLPRWFMTLVSIYGLGFQLLIIGALMALGFINYVIPFFISYSIFIIPIIILRKYFIK